MKPSAFGMRSEYWREAVIAVPYFLILAAIVFVTLLTYAG
jgi:hypothetical protein